MIRYALKCAEGHSFESWFQSASAFDTLAEKGLVSCAVCGSSDVAKAIMAPRVATKETAQSPEPVALETAATPVAAAGPLSAPAHPAEQMLKAMREHLEKHSTYVGGSFAKEARAQHLGESDVRPIHGEAKPEEAKALIEEGVPIAPLPIIPTDKTN